MILYNQVVERLHEECHFVAGLNEAERAETALLQQRLAELRAEKEQVSIHSTLVENDITFVTSDCYFFYVYYCI